MNFFFFLDEGLTEGCEPSQPYTETVKLLVKKDHYYFQFSPCDQLEREKMTAAMFHVTELCPFSFFSLYVKNTSCVKYFRFCLRVTVNCHYHMIWRHRASPELGSHFYHCDTGQKWEVRDKI